MAEGRHRLSPSGVTDFRTLSVGELAQRVRAKQLSARELVAESLDRIDRLNPALNAFVAVDGDMAMDQAAAVDQMVATGGPDAHLALAGVPLAVKDTEDAAGYRTTYGSALFERAPHALHDSPHVARLRAAGCVVVGKTNTPELAFSAHTANAVFGPTRNPWELDHTAGGSSGGTAAALASGMVPLGTGSDGGGSIRIPSACCGLSGMKPSLGRVPQGGSEPPDWLDLSTRGPMARRISDVVTALEVAVAPEPTDLRSLPRPEASWGAALEDPRVPARVAFSPTLGYAPVDAEVRAICERAVVELESLGAEIVEVENVFERDPVESWLTIVGACLARTLHSHRMREEWDRLDPIVAAVVEDRKQVGAHELLDAIDECHRLNLRLVELFHDVRLLVTPTTAGAPPPIDLHGAGIVNGEIDPNWARMTYPFNLTRSPAATVCAGLTAEGLPVGIQLVGPQHADLVVLRSAAALETSLGFEELAPLS